MEEEKWEEVEGVRRGTCGVKRGEQGRDIWVSCADLSYKVQWNPSKGPVAGLRVYFLLPWHPVMGPCVHPLGLQ